jgi:hypothetical protein
VDAPTRIPFTGAADCIRAAELTMSPAAIPSPASKRAPRVISASPVFTAMRTCSVPSSAIQSRIASAARTARSGSSSCASGAPKSAITASPMNFSTVPPNRSSSDRRRAWYGDSTAWTSSGSSRSARAVNPTRSAKSTVTTFRSVRPAGCASASGVPHSEQNFASEAFSRPQFVQILTVEAYGRFRPRPPSCRTSR